MSNLAIYITSCPSCNVKQKINPKAFKLAAGKVNCEKCGCMFDADKHRQRTAPQLSPKTAAAKSNKPSAFDLGLAGNDKQRKNIAANKRFSFSKVLWSLLCLISLCSAALQLLVYNQQQWINIPFLNPVYQQLITFGDVKPKSSDYFRQLSIVIEPAEKYTNVTRVSFSFENISIQAQPLPKAQLTFSDLKGKQVSQRIFDSRDYLVSQNSDMMTVASGKAVAAEIEILQPAMRGLNYQLQLLTPSF